MRAKYIKSCKDRDRFSIY